MLESLTHYWLLKATALFNKHASDEMQHPHGDVPRIAEIFDAYALKSLSHSASPVETHPGYDRLGMDALPAPVHF